MVMPSRGQRRYAGEYIELPLPGERAVPDRGRTESDVGQAPACQNPFGKRDTQTPQQPGPRAHLSQIARHDRFSARSFGDRPHRSQPADGGHVCFTDGRYSKRPTPHGFLTRANEKPRQPNRPTGPLLFECVAAWLTSAFAAASRQKRDQAGRGWTGGRWRAREPRRRGQHRPNSHPP